MTFRPEMRAPARPRSPWQLLYSRLLLGRRRWYANRRLGLPIPVLSIGNLHLGGSGKTPMVECLARHLRDRGLDVVILSRGYGRRPRDIRFASLGKGPLGTVRDLGDEPVMLADRLPGVAIVVGPDRHAAGSWALARLPEAPDVFLLDDGFSHLRLERDLDLLTLPAADPFGCGKLLPSGRLREPLAASTDADAVIVTGAEGASIGQQIAKALERYGFTGRGFAAALETRLAPSPTGSRHLLVTGIARPERVAASAQRMGIEIVEHLPFSDHHRYPEASLERIRRTWQRSGADTVLTTSKDFVKLKARLELPLVEIQVEARPEAAFWNWLGDSLPASMRSRIAKRSDPI